MNLVLVESPTKARTLSRFLGDGYKIEATYGHVRDLPQKKLGVKVEEGFEPEYVVTPKQKERMNEIKKLGDGAEVVYLATDPDREGEAIAWHVAQLLGGKRFKRIIFHEITKRAIEEALEHPGEINLQLVNAQQARRVVDRLVGYKLSPLLWRKVRRGLSAGRVQSVAVRLIVEREREREAFVPQEYWDLVVNLLGVKREEFSAKLMEKNGEKLKISNQEEAQKAETDLRAAQYRVGGVEKKEFSRVPPAPFTTSTLQQAAANRFGWSAKKTMQVAQILYEEGYITYHRTDSTNLAAEALGAARGLIADQFGERYALSNPRFYKTKSKVAQEAHEAIRPTEVSVMAEGMGVNRDQARLYEMIWTRFVACQMAEVWGVSVKVSVSGDAGENKYGLEAKGEIISFDGWYKIYPKMENKDEEARLPEVDEGEKLEFVDLTSQQKFTEAKARYNDASLIKTLEEMGIGRPSTYAPTISTIQDRQYVEKEEKRFKPTALGVAVNDFLVTNFPKIIDYLFTARMEDGLDEIANGEKQWQPVVGEFYEPFEKNLKEVSDTAVRVKVEVETTGEKCPTCTSAGSVPVGEVVIRIGRFGKFLACSRYPTCKYKANFQNKIGMKCPKCQDGDVIMRRTKRGKNFYGCSNYPKCDFASWNKPQIQGEVKTT